MTGPAVIRVPDGPDSIEGIDDLDFDRAAQNGAEVEQLASVETFDPCRGSEIDRKRTERIPHVADERSQIVAIGEHVALRRYRVHW